MALSSGRGGSRRQGICWTRLLMGHAKRKPMKWGRNHHYERSEQSADVKDTRDLTKHLKRSGLRNIQAAGSDFPRPTPIPPIPPPTILTPSPFSSKRSASRV